MTTFLMTTLVLELTCSQAGAIGYGELFACRVRRVIEGPPVPDEVTMVVVVGDDEWSSRLHQADDTPVTVIFEKESDEEARSLPTFTGFVDANQTGWRVREVVAETS